MGYGTLKRSVVLGLWLSVIVMCACQLPSRASHSEPTRAKFGVFFGSQLQQRKDIALVTSQLKQRHGFRLDFSPKRARATTVEWELDFPTKPTGTYGPSNSPRATRKSQATLPSGTDQFEQILEFLPTDVIGTWNIRIRVDKNVVLDKSFRVVKENGSTLND
jgi:ABC-type phosphate/phosphonate transport system substrate-binding protein